jgi:predicted amidophosphoribosyltransferase
MEEVFQRSDGVKIYLLYQPFCEICSTPIPNRYARWGRCAACNKRYGRRVPEIRTRAVARYLYQTEYPGDIFSQNIRDFKTKQSLAPILGECLLHALHNLYPYLMELDIIVPIFQSSPRSYNQAELLAEIVAQGISKPLRNPLFAKDGYPPVHSLPSEKKAEAIHGKVGCREDFKGESILLIDDTYIDGTTKRECARVLREHGSGLLWCLVLGRAVSKRHLDVIIRQNHDDER